MMTNFKTNLIALISICILYILILWSPTRILDEDYTPILILLMIGLVELYIIYYIISRTFRHLDIHQTFENKSGLKITKIFLIIITLIYFPFSIFLGAVFGFIFGPCILATIFRGKGIIIGGILGYLFVTITIYYATIYIFVFIIMLSRRKRTLTRHQQRDDVPPRK